MCCIRFPEWSGTVLSGSSFAYDREMYGKLTALEERYGTISDVSEIDEGIRELEPLVEYFFDDVRKSEAESLMKTYRSAYSKISLVPRAIRWAVSSTALFWTEGR